MASRRLRIKPVANVPVRRGKTTENAEKVEAKTEQPKEPQPEEEESSGRGQSEKSGDQNAEQIKQSNQDSILSVDVTPSVADGGPKGNSEVDVVKPPLLIGKRLKPAVNVAAIKRAPKVSKLEEVTAANETPPENTSQKSECTIDNVKQLTDNHDTVTVPFPKVEDKTSVIVENKPLKTLVRPSLNKAVLSNTVKIPSGDNVAGNELKPVRRYVKAAVNIAALSRSSRKQNTNNLADDKEQFPQEAKKKNLNMTGITERQTKVTPQKSQIEKELLSTNEKSADDAQSPTDENSKPKYRSSKPMPRHGTNSREDYDSGFPSSVAESDDDPSLLQASTLLPTHPEQPKIPILVTSREHRGSLYDSDDETTSKQSFGSDSTNTPPRTFSDVFVRKFREDKEPKKAMKPRVMSSQAIRFRKAKLEFYSKFNGNSTVDRSRLTMMDLIFYNPITNPMKRSEKTSSESSDKQPPAENMIQEEEERVDDPEEGEEEPVALPVPQVKVGPDGQIILDEQSLVIETTGAKKNRETLANSTVIVDTGTTGNGFYKKYNKGKEWDAEETLKFYRALNIIGTDFLVMQSIFPKRSRRDLKLKFKREERTNYTLVEKALRNPLEFDLTELEKELEKEKAEEEAKRKEVKVKEVKVKEVKVKGKKARKRKSEKKSFLGHCMNPENFKKITLRKKRKRKLAANSESDEENDIDSDIEVQKRLSEKGELENETKGDTPMEVESSLTKDGTEVEKEKEEDDEEEEINKELQFLTKPPRPTRCGRMPQQKRPPSIGPLTAKPAGPKQVKQPLLPLKDLSNIEPGSLVVIATQSPTDPNHQVYKVFMVAPPPNTVNTPAIAPVTLSPKVVQPDSESNLKLCSNETLCFTNTQSTCPAAAAAAPPPPAQPPLPPAPPACSGLLTTSLGNSTSAKHGQHYLNTSLQSVISNPQEQTSFITSNTHVLTHVTAPKQHMMSITTSDVPPSESTFIPISSRQSLSSSQKVEPSANPQSKTSVGLPTQASESNSVIPTSNPRSLPISQDAETSEDLPMEVSDSDSLISILSRQSLPSSQEAEISECLPMQTSKSESSISIASPRSLPSQEAEISECLPMQTSKSESSISIASPRSLPSQEAEISECLPMQTSKSESSISIASPRSLPSQEAEISKCLPIEVSDSESLISIASPRSLPSQKAEISECLPMQTSKSESSISIASPRSLPSQEAEISKCLPIEVSDSESLISIASPRSLPSQKAEISECLPMQTSKSESFISIASPRSLPSQKAEISEYLPMQASKSESFISIASPRSLPSQKAEISECLPMQTSKSESSISVASPRSLPSQKAEISECLLMQTSKSESSISIASPRSLPSQEAEISECLPMQTSKSESLISIASPRSLPSSQEAEISECLPIEVSDSESLISIASPPSSPSSQQAKTSNPQSKSSGRLTRHVSQSDSFIPMSSPQRSSEQAVANSVLNFLQNEMKQQ